ncbi:ubiquitin-conjugating enzyme e2, putative [Perkinsus marinus ATCC 50983]|uniref:Ubiquitin-conjugating enzyme e2, putative n=1 Tax=Perkinsus marinus (strain ATCC 50983 / TXsc) TaxID=423536 RepID=C5KN91_PERM5|nr:ubiquitin-conjugating enzyme e2, putative [Perkinsus marinus ATCC 50983]EER14045.1 ubiquitin-conjugating enzyme e2, putative [Perkinsus marinus ATCC 50983]|eukprot:XP_002782250.1 ubiquitin-conjugating enzyme e2, putative [Perkinsus marinus ATCC 50983]
MAAEARQMERDKIDGVTARERAGQSLLLLIGPRCRSSISKLDAPLGDGRGRICMDILKADHWSPLLTLQTVLLSLISLLADPNTGDPLNLEASDELEHFPEVFQRKARQWTVDHAYHKGRIVRPRHEDSNAYLQCDPAGQVVDEDEALAMAFQHSLRSP